MKKETIITAVVFLAVGFLAGYITDSQINWSAQKRPSAASAGNVREQSAGMPGGMGATQGLPEGHPPIDNSAVIKTLEEQVAQNPTNVASRVQLANAYYDGAQWSKAIEAYQKTLELDPKNVGARTDLGTAYYNTGRPQEALREYAKSLEIDPSHQPTIFNTIIVQLHGNGDTAAAQAAWDKLNKMNPSYPGLNDLKQQIQEARAGGSTGR